MIVKFDDHTMTWRHSRLEMILGPRLVNVTGIVDEKHKIDVF